MSVFIVCVAALVISFAFVKLTHIGPVILTISAKHGWGVHTGDLLVFIPLGGAFIYALSKLL